MADLLTSTFAAGTQSYSIDRYAARTGPAKRPVVVVMHGVDGMVGESDTEIRKMAVELADAGYLVFVPHYLEAPGRTSMPSRDELAQRIATVDSFRPRIAAAFDYATTRAESDPTRVATIGLSLGGGLALWHATSSPKGRVKAVVDFFGHISDRAIYTDAGKLPPTLVFHNHGDQIVGRQMSIDLKAALATAGVANDGEIYNEQPPYTERWEHTFRPGGKADVDSRSRTRKWLDKYVKP